MPNFKVILSYDGTNYSGFQRQENSNSVQEEIEKALKIIYGQKISVISSGRTDSGVHAKEQVINFKADNRVPPHHFPEAFRGLLPRDIVAWHSEEVADDFHARASAKEKEYCYTIDNAPYKDVFLRYYAYHIDYNLDVEAMQAAASYIVGKHDFSSFRAAGSDVKENVRIMTKADIYKEGTLIKMTFRADGYLYKMIRILVGTIVLVGKGKLPSKEMQKIISARCRDAAGPTAPPHGLCLEKVIYEPVS